MLWEQLQAKARVAAALLFWIALATSASAQFRETFESPDHLWKLANADCGVRVISQQRTFDQAHEGSGSEHLRFVAGQGTHLYYTFDLGRSPIIDESNYSLWLKADRARLQFLVRVVLPRTLDERTGKPITALLQGGEYGEIGAWQKLEVKNLKKLLARQTVVLRKQFGPHVDPSEAFIDLLVLNVYGGAGETNVWIDDLEVLGVVDSEWAKNSLPDRAGDEEPVRAGERPAVIEGNVLLVENRPLLVRAIEHRGEPLEIVKTLGFNTVYLTVAPTSELNAEARRLGLWLVAPPPNLAADTSAASRLDRVITWQLGQNLGSSEIAATRSLVAELHSADRTLRRPLLAGITSDAWSYSREADLLSWETAALFSARAPTSIPARLRAQSSEARVGAPFWANVRLAPPPELMEQLGLLDGAAPQSLSPDLDQARLTVFSALAGGARGLLFRSTARLDGDDETSQQLAAILRLLNLELNLIEPWFAGGSAPSDVATGDPTLKATVLQTERSRLVLLTRDQPLGQFVTPPIANDTIVVSLPGVPASDRYYHLTADGLRQLERPANGRVVIPESGHTALLAVTQDPLVIQHLTRICAAQRREAVETRLRLASNQLSATALIAEEIRPTLAPPRDAVAMLREAQRNLNEADQLLIRGDLTGCFRHTRRVEKLVTETRRTWWDAARGTFSSPLASPCCVSYDTLPSHVRLGVRLQQGTWTQNGLPGGDCEQLDQLLATGWKQQRASSTGMVTGVELSTDAPHGGANCVRLSAVAPAEKELVFTEPAVSITTGAVQVRAGQVARLHGFVRVPQPLRGINGSLLVYDNLAGTALAESIAHSPTWREFTLYRAVPRDGELTLTFALAGSGEASFDDVTIELTTPTAPREELRDANRKSSAVSN